MMTIANIPPSPSRPIGNRLLLVPVVGLSALLATALLRRAATGAPMLPTDHALWLELHLGAVVPALPLGGYLLWRRKGDRVHRMLGRAWAVMMLLAAISSFGLRSSGHLSWIHLLSVLVLVTIPRGVMQAMRSDIRAHKRSMSLNYVGLITAGAFAFVPGRLLGSWLLG